MARSIMDVVQENVNPVSVSNSLYEMMVDWRSCVVMLETGAAKSKNKVRHKKMLIERYLSLFMGIHPNDMRKLLSEHFGVNGENR